ncbi:hypothetical protein [Citrobacter portucalensis]|uniref:hypothetical protein n=1 Tax=Citrobacter portucalensis TaxID=1639133 RepID=UPI001BCC95ED|nr:hypothetical protein [Citrobacter portucalensis]
MNNNPTNNNLVKVTFSYDDSQRNDEIIALKTFVFSILRNLPHDVAINTVKTIKGTHENPALNSLCKEMVDAMIASSSINKED